jgi:hypothetical protein
MSRKTKRSNKKNKTQRIKKGGENVQQTSPQTQEQIIVQLDKFQITNTEILFFLIDFLNKNNLKNILLTHHQLIDNIENEKLIFNENPKFRKLINDIIQWFLLDYNQSFSNGLLEIIKNTIQNPVFLSKTSSPDDKYNVLLMSVYAMIVKYNNSEDVEFFSLLEILLRGLRMPKVKGLILSNLQVQQDNLIQYKSTIVCLLDNMIKKDLLHKEEIRKLMKEILEELSYTTAYNWATFKKLVGLVSSCALSVTSNVTAVAAKGAYNATTNAASSAYNATSNAASSLYKNTVGSFF